MSARISSVVYMLREEGKQARITGACTSDGQRELENSSNPLACTFLGPDQTLCLFQAELT